MSVLADVMAEASRRFPDRRALVAGGIDLTYAQLAGVAGELAHGLAARGVGPGTVAALVLPSGAEYIVAYLALAQLGAVTTGINPRYTAAERTNVLDIAQPDVVLAFEEFADGVPVRVATVLAAPAAGNDELWRHERRPDAAPATRVRTDPDDPETVVFTSGTTGTPRGAVFCARQLLAITAMDTGGVWGAGGPQLVATGLPHIGFMTKLAGHLQMGATLHVLPRWTAADALRIIARERVAYVGGVAAQVALLLRHADFASHDFSAVQGLIVGAGPSPLPLVREARERFGAGYSIRYSSTESGGLGTLTAFDAPDHEYETVGRPRPGTDIEIRSPETGAVVAPGAVGQICIRSPAVMAGYWRDPEATAAALDDDGWLRTGDLGVVRDDGCLQISGRISEMYIRGGYNVFPQEVEAVLLDHPAVGSVAVIPRPDPVMGEIGVAVVVARPGASAPDLAELRAFAAPRLAAFKLPEAMRVVDVLPLTSMDKLDRRGLAAEEADRARG